MADMTLAQTMEWFATTDTHDLVRGLQAGHVLAAEIRRRDGETCAWIEDDDAIWHTACGHSFFFDTDGPVENKLEYCCYCGKRGAWQKREGE